MEVYQANKMQPSKVKSFFWPQSDRINHCVTGRVGYTQSMVNEPPQHMDKNLDPLSSAEGPSPYH